MTSKDRTKYNLVMEYSGNSNGSYDAVVIGSGVGGSACGAILAAHGFKVLILEKNPRIGGSCSYYEKDGFKIDIGTHMFIRGNKGPIGVCTRRLGMGTPIEFRRTRDIAWVRGFNVDVRLPASLLRLPFFLLHIYLQARFPVTAIPRILQMLYRMLTMTPAEIEQWDRRTVDEFILSYTRDPYIHSLFGLLLGLYFVLPPWSASAGESIWNLQSFIKDYNLGYPRGGAVAVPQTILNGARSHGATVLTNTAVQKILVENGAAVGVAVPGGIIRSPIVVSTTSLEDTIRLAGKEHFPLPYRQQVQDIKGSLIAVQAKIGLKKKVTGAGCVCGVYPRQVPRENLTRENMLTNFVLLQSGRIPQFTPIYCPIPTNFDSSLAPPGRQLLTACAIAPTTDVTLQDPPEAWIEKMLAALYELIPGVKENVLFLDTFTVQDLADWIGKSSGAAITTAQTPDQVGAKRPGHLTPIKGLYVCGDNAGARGVGTELACQSGMDCADLIHRQRRQYPIGDS